MECAEMHVHEDNGMIAACTQAIDQEYNAMIAACKQAIDQAWENWTNRDVA